MYVCNTHIIKSHQYIDSIDHHMHAQTPLSRSTYIYMHMHTILGCMYERREPARILNIDTFRPVGFHICLHPVQVAWHSGDAQEMNG